MHVSFKKAAKLQRPEVDVPDAIVDLRKRITEAFVLGHRSTGWAGWCTFPHVLPLWGVPPAAAIVSLVTLTLLIHPFMAGLMVLLGLKRRIG